MTRLAISIILSVLVVVPALGQTDITYTPQMPTHGVGHDYIGLLNETVNPADGNVNLSINFPLPKGRGLTIPFSLVYSSSTLGALNGRSNQDFLSYAGWSYTFPLLSYVQGKIQIGTVNEADGTNEPQYCYYSSNYAFHAAGTGSQHPLGLSQTNPWGQPQNGASCSTTPALVGGDPDYQATLASNNDCQPSCVTQGATVADADGTIYVFTGALDWGGGASQGELLAMPSYIEDRNGNRVTIQNNYSSCCVYTGGASIIDDAGRTALSTSGFGKTGNTISVSGISTSYKLTWGTNSQLLIPVTEYGQSLDPNSPCGQSGTSGVGSQPSLGVGVTTLLLPNGQSYTFSYDSTYGLLKKITYPSGGYIAYTWGLNKNSSAFDKIEVITSGQDQGTWYCVYTVDQPAITKRQVSFDGTNIALTQTFNYSTSWSSPQIGWIGSETTTVTTTDNVTGLSYSTVYTYGATSGGHQPNDPPVQPTGFGLFYPSEEQTVKYFKGTNTSGAPLRTATKGWIDSNDSLCEVDTLDNGQMAGFFNTYGRGGGLSGIQLLADKKEYDYGLLSSATLCNNTATPPSNITPTRETSISYHTFAPQPLFLQPFPSSPVLTLGDRPASTISYGSVGGSMAKVAETDYGYDETSVSSVNGTPTGHDETNYSASSVSPPRGNATTKRVECLQGCQTAITTYGYNDLGQVASMTDPCGQVACGDISGTGHTTAYSYGPAYSYAYLTEITDPLGHYPQFEYNLSGGDLSFAIDQNGRVTNYLYNDPLDRLTEANFPDGGDTTYAYHDGPYNPTSTPPTPSVTTTKLVTSGVSAVSISAADGTGHAIQTQFTDPDGLDYTATTYDGKGRKRTVTNPYRTASDSTYGTTINTYDALGRVTLVSEPDGSKVQTAYCGPSTLVTDEAGHWRRSRLDGLGRLVEVDEPNSSTASVTACPQSGDPTITTTYTYDALDNITSVLQGGSRQRTFVYDSLSRLLASCNPETCSGSGTVTVPASNATGTITISWNGCTSGCSGDKVLTYVNGTGTGNECFAFFTGGESSSAVAAAAASAINNNADCSKYVTATTNGSVVTLTSLTAGSQGDYSFSASINGTSYTATTSGPTLTQGAGYSFPGGSTTYTYDANGNLTSKTGPAQNQTGSATVTLSYCYDNLNRMISKAYTAQSCPMTAPVATYSYDQTSFNGLTITNGIGRRTSMTDAAGSEAWSYDTMGRILTNQRTTNGVTKTAVYTYAPYVDGSLYSLQYPSGRTITYNTGPAERLLSAIDSSNSIYYATGAHYAPTGGLSSLINNDNIFTTQLYNVRVQPCWTYVTTGTALAGSTACTATESTSGNLLDLRYNFNVGNGTSGTDNGNVVGITNNRDTTRSQAFTYDWLNRIATAETTSTDSTSSVHCWSQQFGYDVWANLLGIQAGPSAYNGCTQPSALTVTITSQNQITGYTYDAAGNLETIPGTGGASYSYDAENHLSSTSGITYVYDGDGNRIEKSGRKIYWYGTDGSVLDETDSTGSTTNSNFSEYIYFGSQRIARRNSAGNVYYYFADHLGTSRAMAQVLSGQSAATLCYDADFYPFGGERAPTNTCAQNYKFTGKERDSESNLDNFGDRYFGSSLGRFMSPDPGQAAGFDHMGDPQSWNGYAYVRNNPTTLTDADGDNYTICDTNGKNCADLNEDQYKQYLQSLQGTNTTVNSAGQIQHTNDNGSVTNLGTATYYNEQDVAAARMLVQTGVTLSDPRTIAGFYGASFLLGGCAIACPAAGSAALTLGRGVYYALAGLLPAVPTAIDKLQKLGISISEANELIESPTTQKLIDNANNGNINYIADVGGKLVRITTDPTGQRIISAGMVRANQIANGIANGRFTQP